MTFSEASTLRYGQILFTPTASNADGSPQRWRVNGKVKRWKRLTHRIQVPLKNGLWDYHYLSEANLHLFFLAEKEAIAARKTGIHVGFGDLLGGAS